MDKFFERAARWYGQGSNQLALGALLTAGSLYLHHTIDGHEMAAAALGFLAVAVKDQANVSPPKP